MADKKVSIDILASDRTKAAFDSVKRGLGEVGSKVDAVKGVFSAFSVLAASAGLAKLMTEAVAAASKAEQSSNRLDAVLRATGNTVGFTREQLDKMADSLTRATTFDDEGIRDAQANLIKFGRLHGATFEHALKLSADYAAFTGGDMVDATQMIGRALADPVHGVTALGKALGTLTDAQKVSIETFVSQGRIAEAQAIVFKKLEGAIGGTAGAMNTGLYGATTAATKAWGELLEAIGKSSLVKNTAEVSLGAVATGLREIQGIIEKGDWTKTMRAILGAASPLQSLSHAIVSSALTGDKSGRTATGRIQGADQRTPAEIEAQGRGSAAAAEEARQALMEAAAKKEAALVIQRAKSREEISAETYKRWQDQMKAHLKIVGDLRQNEFDNAVQMGGELRQLFEENQDATAARQVEEAEMAHSRSVAVFQSLQTESAAVEQDFVRRSLALKAWIEDRDLTLQEMRNSGALTEDEFNQKRIEANAMYYDAMKRVDVQYSDNKLKLKSVETQRLQAIWNSARKGELSGIASLFAEGIPLMQAGSQRMFAIGKAAALASATVNMFASIESALATVPFFPVGLAMGALAAAKGIINIQAIRAASFTGGGAVGTGTFSASPSTGLPDSPSAPPSPIQQLQRGPATQINVQLLGSGRYTAQEIRSLITDINEQLGDGMSFNVT